MGGRHETDPYRELGWSIADYRVSAGFDRVKRVGDSPVKPEFAPSATITFYVVADSYIYSASPTQTHGSDTILYVGSPSASAGRVAGGPAWTNGDAGPDSEHSHADGAN